MKKLMLSALLIVGAGVASAKADVSVGISFRLPTPFHPPMVIARAVAPVVCAPAPAVVYAPPVCAPAPVVCAPAPVVYAPAPVYYRGGYYARPHVAYRGHSYIHGRPDYRHDSRSDRNHHGSHGGYRR